VMVAFDLLYLNGYDLRKLPLLERKKLLKKIIVDIDVQFSESFEVDGREMYNACSIGLEGVVSKVRDSRYISGGANSWVKKTCAQRETLPVAGFALKQNKFDGIYVGRRRGKDLVYAGKIDHGFDTASAKEMQTRLKPLICKRQPYAKKIAHRGVWGRAITLGRNRIPRQVGRGQSGASVFQGLAGGYVMKTMIEYEELPRERRLRDASQEATGWKFETIEHDEMTFPAPSEGPMRKAGRVFT
jgi:bifunctional non-homologous end joining protein LigD